MTLKCLIVLRHLIDPSCLSFTIYLSMFTVDKSDVYLRYIVSVYTVSSVHVMTLPDHSYNQMSKTIITQSWIVFSVQACRDAHVALSELFNNLQSRTYEIIIGGNENRNSFIRDSNTFIEVQRVDTVDIMDCYNYKTFWVKWDANYRITVGRGAYVDMNHFLNWVDPEKRNFQGLSISTYYDQPGLWDFSFLDGIQPHLSFLIKMLDL